jgi:hypothetical protein
MKEKAQALSNKLRQIAAGQFVQLTKPHASGFRMRQSVQCFKPGLRVKNRFNRKR